jgi:hypothetical protein
MKSFKFSTIYLLSIGDSMPDTDKREYSLGVLIILVLFCWPAALIYYFTRPVVRRSVPLPPPGMAAPPPPSGSGYATCPTCGGPLRYIQQYQRWYCDKEQKYA